jgi:hypothetical protein
VAGREGRRGGPHHTNIDPLLRQRANSAPLSPGVLSCVFDYCHICTDIFMFHV